LSRQRALPLGDGRLGEVQPELLQALEQLAILGLVEEPRYRFRDRHPDAAEISKIRGVGMAILLISSTAALRSAFMVPKWRASSFATCAPTWRIPSAKSSVDRGCCFDAWIASTSCRADFSANPSSESRSVGVSSYRSATSLMSF